jgi:iron complex outermembrane receptor protein
MSRLHTSAFAAFALVSHSAAYGQTSAPAVTAPTTPASPTVTLPTVTVTGAPIAPLDAAPPGFSTPTVGQTTNTVTRNDFKDQANVSIGDVLLQAPGVTVSQGNGPRDVSISIRGSNARQTYGVRNIQVFEDGFPVTQPDGLSRTDLTDPHAYNSIDVVQGPSSAAYGNYATGGALLYHTIPGKDIQGFDLGTDGGSFGYLNNYGTAGFAGPGWQVSLFGSNVRGDGFTTHSRYDTATANLLASYDLTPDDRLTLKLIHNSLVTQLPIRLSLNQFNTNPFQQGCENAVAAGCGSITVYKNGKNGPTVVLTASQAGLNRHDERDIVGVGWEHTFDSDTVWRTVFDFDDRDISQPTGATSAVGPYTSVNVISNITHRGAIGDLPTVSSFGVNFNDERFTSRTYNIIPGGGAQLGALTQTVFGNQSNGGGRGRVEIDLSPTLKAVAAAGAEWSFIHANETNFAYPLAGGQTASVIPASRDFFDAAPEAALIYAPDPQWQFHTRAAGGYGTPQYSNLFITPGGQFGNNTQLQPQTNIGVDVGGKYQINEHVKVELTGFYEFFHDELVTQSAGAGLQSYTYNAPASEHRGVELAATYRPLLERLPGFKLLLAYLYNNQIYTTYVEQLTNSAVKTPFSFNRAGNAIPGVAPNELFARAAYEEPAGPLAGLGGFAEVVFRDAAYLDNANVEKAPAYALVNIEVHYDPNLRLGPFSAFRAFFEVQNLFNKTYVASASNITDTVSAKGVEGGPSAVAASTGSIWAGSPRAFYGGLKMHF